MMIEKTHGKGGVMHGVVFFCGFIKKFVRKQRSCPTVGRGAAEVC